MFSCPVLWTWCCLAVSCDKLVDNSISYSSTRSKFCGQTVPIRLFLLWHLLANNEERWTCQGTTGVKIQKLILVLPGRDPLVAENENRLEDLAKLYLAKRDTGGFSCNICYKVSKDRHAGKCHLDSKHFPSQFGHSCSICGKVCKSKHALVCHVSIYHRNK